jgi:hypothetical protein
MGAPPVAHMLRVATPAGNSSQHGSQRSLGSTSQHSSQHSLPAVCEDSEMGESEATPVDAMSPAEDPAADLAQRRTASPATDPAAVLAQRQRAIEEDEEAEFMRLISEELEVIRGSHI